jgi:hypothetical protein
LSFDGKNLGSEDEWEVSEGVREGDAAAGRAEGTPRQLSPSLM